MTDRLPDAPVSPERLDELIETLSELLERPHLLTVHANRDTASTTLLALRHYKALREASQAVIDRWDTPLWKDAPATAIYINKLREVAACQRELAETKLARLCPCGIETLQLARESLVCTKQHPYAYDCDHHCSECGSSGAYVKSLIDEVLALNKLWNANSDEAAIAAQLDLCRRLTTTKEQQ